MNSPTGVTGSTGSGATQAYYQSLKIKTASSSVSKAGTSSSAAATVVDQFTAGSKAEGKAGAAGAGYTKEAAMQKAQRLADAQFASMKGAVEGFIGSSGGTQGQAFWAMSAGGKVTSGGGVNVKDFMVSDETRAKAKELIGEDGYYGVKRTTDRIMEFAKALAGSGASEKTINDLRKGVQAGFDAVSKMYGGFDNLPQVSKDTYSAVMKEFDNWASGAKVAS
jgi:hypothetical protein